MDIYQDKEFLGTMGSYLIENDFFELALNYFNHIIDIDPNEPRAWASKGHILLKLKSYQEAINCCKKALEYDPSHMGARDTLGSLYYLNHDYDAMISNAKEALELMPEDIKTILMLSEALSISGKLVEAESEANKALKYIKNEEYIKREDLAMTYQQIGMINVMRGHKNDALLSFQKAIDALPKDDWLQDLNESYEILEILDLALEGNPSKRRNQLIKLTEIRNNTRKGINVREDELIFAKIFTDSFVSQYPSRWVDDFFKPKKNLNVIAKYWPSKFFIKIRKFLSNSKFINFSKDISRIINSES